MSGKRYKSQRHIIEETGEVVNVIEYLTEEEKNARSKYIQRQQRLQRITGDYKNFYFLVYEKHKLFKQKIKDESMVRIIFLATYLNYNGYLAYDNGVPITKDKLKDLLGVSKGIFYDFFNEMESIEMFKVDDEGKIYLNNNNFRKGKMQIKDDYARMFNDTIRSLYKGTDPRSHTKLAIVFKLIPFINYKFNVLCWDSREMDKNEIKFLSLTNIMQIFNYNPRHKKRLLETLIDFRFKLDEQEHYVFRYVLSDAKMYNGIFMVNPLIIYRGEVDERERAELIYGADFKDKFVELEIENDKIKEKEKIKSTT